MRVVCRKVCAIVLIIALCIPVCGEAREDGDVLQKSSDIEWNISALQAEAAYQDSQNVMQIKVAVIDSGLDYDSRIPFVERKDFMGEDEDNINQLYQDMTGHGTSVAGLICGQKNDAQIRGLASNVDLYVARVLDFNNQAPVSRVIEAIEWAISKDVKIIHMSFGTVDDYEDLHQVIKKAYQHGILIIAAAGNQGTADEDESTVEYPAAYPEVLSVGATSIEGTKADISSSGDELDVVAPGDKILTFGAFGGVFVQDGTSMAAAQVTGIAAVLWGQHPNETSEYIKGLLIGSANSSDTLKHCGNGMVDYDQAQQVQTVS